MSDQASAVLHDWYRTFAGWVVWCAVECVLQVSMLLRCVWVARRHCTDLNVWQGFDVVSGCTLHGVLVHSKPCMYTRAYCCHMCTVGA